MKMRTHKAIKILLAMTVLVLAGRAWASDRDAVFDRGPTLNGARGWLGGDGAISVQLPPGDGTLWIFGDSFISGYDPVTHQRIPITATLADVVFGDTIGIQQGSSPSDPASIHFYARTYEGVISDVTTNVVGGRASFFDSTMLGLPPSPGTFFWPQGGKCLFCADGNPDNDKIALAFTHVQFCNPQVDGNQCQALCLSGLPADQCTTGVRILPRVISRIENPRDPMESWQIHSIVLEGPDISWGSSFVEDPHGLYIFGVDTGGLVLARVNPDDLLNQGRWEYWAKGRWGSSLEGLVPVAENVGPLVSVDKIVRRGKTRWVLVYDHPVGDHYIYVRTTSDPTRWKPADKNTTTKVDLLQIDESLRKEIQISVAAGKCTPTNLQGCSISYHGLGHLHLSPRDNHGTSSLVLSYVIPYPPEDNSSNADYYHPRFYSIPLDSVKGW
jgi:hypothetical protein